MMQVYQAMRDRLGPAWEGPQPLVACAKNIHRLRGPGQGFINQSLRARVEVVKLIVFSMLVIGKRLLEAALIVAVVICPLEIMPSVSYHAFKGLVDTAKLGIAILITGSLGLVRPEISLSCYQQLSLLQPKKSLLGNISGGMWICGSLIAVNTVVFKNAVFFKDAMSARTCEFIGNTIALSASVFFVTRTLHAQLAAVRLASAWNGPASLVACARNIRSLRGPQQGFFKQSLKARLEVIKLIAVSLIEIGRCLIERKLVDAAKLGMGILVSGSLGLVRPEISLICYQQLALMRPKLTLVGLALPIAFIASTIAKAVFQNQVRIPSARPDFTLLLFNVLCAPVLCFFAYWTAMYLVIVYPTRTPEFVRRYTGLGLVDVSELNESPTAVLQKMDRYFTRPIREIVFIEQGAPRYPGAGAGVIRVFYSRIFGSLIAKGTAPVSRVVPEAAADQLNFFKAADDRMMPFLAANDAKREQKLRGFQTVGKLFARCHFDKFTIGELFSEMLYQLILSFTSEELVNSDEIPDNVRIRSVQIERSQDEEGVRHQFSLLQKDSLSQDEYDSLRALAEQVMPGEMPSGREAMNGENLAWVKETILDNCESTILPAFWIAKGMHQILGDAAWNDLKTLGHQDVQEAIEGVVTTAAVQNGLRFEGVKHAATEAYASEWVSRAPKERLRRFVFFATGSNSLGKDGKIFLDLSTPAVQVDNQLMIQDHANKPLPSAATCHRKIIIPTVYADQEEFNHKLEYALDNYPLNSKHSGLDRH